MKSNPFIWPGVQRLVNGRSFILVSLAIAFILVFPGSFAQPGKWVAPKEADAIVNPLKGNSSGLAETRKLYTANCGPCHGDKGRGDGPASAGLNPKPADHTSAMVQSQTDGAIFWKLSEGHMPMPAYKKVFSDEQRWGLVNFIRTLSAKK